MASGVPLYTRDGRVYPILPSTKILSGKGHAELNLGAELDPSGKRGLHLLTTGVEPERMEVESAAKIEKSSRNLQRENQALDLKVAET